MVPRIFTINHSDSSGGAARAAYRLHRALLGSRVDSKMLVNDVRTGDWTVEGPQTMQARLFARYRGSVGGLLTRVLKTGNPILHSPAVLPSRWAPRLNDSNADIVHLHWINSEMMSISDIGRIRKPLVWTLHDMWAFCGAEHYTEDFRWHDGYKHNNRSDFERGFDLNRWTWERKRNHWVTPMHIVSPSHWLAECVRQSALMGGWPVSVIQNAIDTEAWQPIEQSLARKLLHLPADVPLLLFGAIGGSEDPRKGFDLLKAALVLLRGQVQEMELVIFGQPAPKVSLDLGFPIHYAGHLHDDISLQLLYGAADIMVIPSRQDNLPNTGVEALACGTPVVAFDTCGLPDIVQHEKTGYLAKAFDAEYLAQGIKWVLEDRKRYDEMCVNARADAVERFSYPRVAEQYLQVYQDTAASGQG